MDIRVVLFDMETQILAQELSSGWSDPESLRVSMLAYSKLHWVENKCAAFYMDIVRENEVQDFFSAVANSELVVGWGASYFSQILDAYDDGGVLRTRPIVDLKHLTQKHSNDRTVGMYYLAESLGLKKMGRDGMEAVELYRKGYFYELSRFSLWDVNILNIYWTKIMKSVPHSGLLVLNGDKKQVKINLYDIKEEIIRTIERFQNRPD